MVTVATLGDSLVRNQSRVRKKLSKGRPDLWTLGLLSSNKKRMKKGNN